MTGGTLPTPMVGRLIATVAGFAIRGSHRIMIKIGLRPICRIVTGRALARVVVYWPIIRMAGFAICRFNCLVIEIYLRPIGSIVADRALSLEMISRFIS